MTESHGSGGGGLSYLAGSWEPSPASRPIPSGAKHPLHGGLHPKPGHAVPDACMGG